MYKKLCFMKTVLVFTCVLYSSFASSNEMPLLAEDGRVYRATRAMMPPTGSYAPPQWGPDTRIPMERPVAYSHISHVGGSVQASDGGQIFLNPQITQILEHSPNRFVYSQMLSLPPVDLTGAFEAADGNYRATPQARSAHLGTFKAIAEAGHPLAKERYADLLFENLSVAERDMRSDRRFDGVIARVGNGGQGEGLFCTLLRLKNYKKEHSNRAAWFKQALNFYNDCLPYYNPSSAYLYQLRAKIDRTSQAIENEDRQIANWKRKICCVLGIGTAVLAGVGTWLGITLSGAISP